MRWTRSLRSRQPGISVANRDHEGASGISEKTYCDRYRVGVTTSGGSLYSWGSCYFTDHGPPRVQYKLGNDDRTTQTPSNVVFRRDIR